MSKKGILKSRAREIVIHADKYFQNEREDSKVLLKELSQLLNKVGNSSHVLLSKELLAKLVDYLKNTTKVTERVVAATGICKNTVAKIRSEKKTSMANCSKIQSPTKKKTRKKTIFRQFWNYGTKKYNKFYLHSAKNHVQRLRDQYWTKDRLMDDLFIINTGDGSDAESSECVSGSEDTSEEEEYMSGVEEYNLLN